MKLIDPESNKEYEFITDPDYYMPVNTLDCKGTLKPIEKEWPQEGDKYWSVRLDGTVFFDAYNNEEKLIGIYRTQEEAELARDRIQSLKEADIHYVGDISTHTSGTIKVSFLVPKKYLKAWEALEDKK